MNTTCASEETHDTTVLLDPAFDAATTSELVARARLGVRIIQKASLEELVDASREMPAAIVVLHPRTRDLAFRGARRAKLIEDAGWHALDIPDLVVGPLPHETFDGETLLVPSADLESRRYPDGYVEARIRTARARGQRPSFDISRALEQAFEHAMKSAHSATEWARDETYWWLEGRTIHAFGPKLAELRDAVHGHELVESELLARFVAEERARFNPYLPFAQSASLCAQVEKELPFSLRETRRVARGCVEAAVHEQFTTPATGAFESTTSTERRDLRTLIARKFVDDGTGTLSPTSNSGAALRAFVLIHAVEAPLFVRECKAPIAFDVTAHLGKGRLVRIVGVRFAGEESMPIVCEATTNPMTIDGGDIRIWVHSAEADVLHGVTLTACR